MSDSASNGLKHTIERHPIWFIGCLAIACFGGGIGAGTALHEESMAAREAKAATSVSIATGNVERIKADLDSTKEQLAAKIADLAVVQSRIDSRDKALRETQALADKYESQTKDLQAQAAIATAREKKLLADNVDLQDKVQKAVDDKKKAEDRARTAAPPSKTTTSKQSGTLFSSVFPYYVGKSETTRDGCCSLYILSSDPSRRTATVALTVFKERWEGTLTVGVRSYAKLNGGNEFWLDLRSVDSVKVEMSVAGTF